ncbi:hypothetical protein MHB54_00960 [Paenibacillus sp. FSL M7-0802]|uniref:hypothetical protein n=1 Tax=Paenibacillus sp. FSL M7-0802 TaxID=2921536 RepID=UPI0030F9766B
MKNMNSVENMMILKNLLDNNKKLTQAVDNQNEVTSKILAKMINEANRAEKSETVAVIAAEIALDSLNEIKNHECLSNAQCALLSLAIKDKTTEITNKLYPNYDGKEFSKKWGYVNRGLWTIFKNNVNGGSKAPYSTTLKIKFKAAKTYIEKLNVKDYLSHRNGEFFKIQKFHFELAIEEKAKTIQDIINERLDNKISQLKQINESESELRLIN